MARLALYWRAEYLAGFVVTVLLSAVGDTGTFVGVVGTSLTMAVTALRLDKHTTLVTCVIGLALPLASTEAGERACGRPVAAVLSQEKDQNGHTTLTNMMARSRPDEPTVKKPHAKKPTAKKPPVVRPRAPKPALAITVTPPILYLTCADTSCGGWVRITSAGTRALVVGSIEIVGGGAANFHHNKGCAHQRLDPAERCLLRVWFVRPRPGKKSSAQLVIHQNLKKYATYLTVYG